jgi:aryl-alcohol dehydrogenase
VRRLVGSEMCIRDRGRMPVDKLIQRFPFDDINRAAEGIVDGSVVKPVLVFPEEA